MMSLGKYLGPGEDIVAQAGEFYATTFRVIRRTVDKQGKEDVRFMPYSSLETVELVTRPNHRLMLLGTALAVLSLPSFFYLVVSPFIMLAVGIGLVVYGGVDREVYYQLRARNMTEAEARVWRLPRKTCGQLAATIKHNINDRM